MNAGQEICLTDGSPDEVLVRQDAIADLYLQVRKSQVNNSWEGSIRPDEMSGSRIGRFLRRILRKPGPLQARVKAIAGLLIKVDWYENLESEDVRTAVELLYELSKCPVLRFDDPSPCKQRRYVFFNDSEHWRDWLPQLHAVWSDNDRVVVYFWYGHVWHFYKWAVNFQPDLAHRLQNCGDKIVVIVPSIRHMTRGLLSALETQRDRIWRNSNVT